MELPRGGSSEPWPPKSLTQDYDSYREWAAWYSGRASQLELYYGGYVTRDKMGFFDPTTTAQPLTSVFRRMFFWARQQPAAISRGRYHVPVASDLSTVSADQLFADPPRLLIPEAHAKKSSASAKKVQARLDELTDKIGLFSTFGEGAEIASAFGGSFMQTQYDTELFPDFPLLQIIHPDSAIPEFQWGRLTGVIFWRQVDAEGGSVFRHLELHSKGKITHGLYRGSERMLGLPVPLTEVPATARFAGLVDSGSEIATGLPGLDCVYVPNMRPNRQNRGSDLGRSDYQSTEDLMDGADETMTSWMRDIRLGKARAFVAEEYLQANPKGKGTTFDIEREVYEQLKTSPDMDLTKAISFHQFTIRVKEHEQTLTNLMERIFSTAGFSASTFGLKGAENIEQTATQIVSKEHRTQVTRGKKIRHWSPAIGDILEMMLGIDTKVFKGPGVFRPRADFPDMVHDSLKDSSQAIQFLDAAKAISLKTKVELAHPTWDPAEVQTEVDAIKAEQAAATAAAMPSISSTPPADGGKPGQQPSPLPDNLPGSAPAGATGTPGSTMSPP